ncbi:ATP-binding cassette domain-containing protein [Mycoplasma struthionis]|uniref:ATP-binding cassette domain-containing protein n=1 Tax=Mycoplasma struthionis TaxID=538220 RepID=UPI001FED1E90|nr:ATP-binding cassette domain-containing protein [Mycoplasma struthionis]
MEIQFKNYFAKYEKKDQNLVLENINFLIPQGSMVAIIGPSGAGKSTIFNAILDQLEIQSGVLEIDNKNLKDLSKKEHKKLLTKIGYLGQEPNLIEDLNVYENILHLYSQYKNFIFTFFKILTKKQKLEVFSVLEKLGILDKAFIRVSELSGGQKQRVEIAKLLLQKSELILADEPTSSLDILNAKEVINLLKI